MDGAPDSESDGADGDDAAQSVDATMEAASDDSSLGDDGTTADAGEEPVYLEAGVDEVITPVCTGPLPDAGFSTLADLPVASLCAQSGGVVWEGGPPCQGSIVVLMATGVDSGQWWLFDAATGALEAVGGGTNGDFACSGGMAGFQFPYQCFNNDGWPLRTNLCADAGPDAAADAGD